MIFERGDVILKSEPYAIVPFSNWMEEGCSYCMSGMDVLRRCSGCLKAVYCSRICQKSDFAAHKFECKSFKKGVPDEMVRLIARVYHRYMIEQNGGLTSEEAFGSNISINDLSLPDEAILLERADEINSTVEQASRFLSCSIDDELLRRLSLIVLRNASISVEIMHFPSTLALYIVPSKIPHSCELQDYCCQFDARSFIMRAACRVEVQSIEALRRNYADHMDAPRSVRQNILHRMFIGGHECPRCSQEPQDFLEVCDQETIIRHSEFLKQWLCSPDLITPLMEEIAHLPDNDSHKYHMNCHAAKISFEAGGDLGPMYLQSALPYAVDYRLKYNLALMNYSVRNRLRSLTANNRPLRRAFLISRRDLWHLGQCVLGKELAKERLDLD